MVVLLIFMIVAIAAFNVVSMLMMSVIDKRKDIAILQTLGLSRAQVIWLFLTQGMMIGLLGISIGVVLGVTGCYWVGDLVSYVNRLWAWCFLIPRCIPLIMYRWICAGQMLSLSALPL